MKKGITCIEVLVIIAIIAILAAIMFPVYLQARYHHGIHHVGQSSYHIVSDQYVGGNHIQIMEDDFTHTQYKLINNKVVQ